MQHTRSVRFHLCVGWLFSPFPLHSAAFQRSATVLRVTAILLAYDEGRGSNLSVTEPFYDVMAAERHEASAVNTTNIEYSGRRILGRLLLPSGNQVV